MASRAQEIKIRRIIACFAPGRAVAPGALASLAKETQAELLGLFIEDLELLRFAALPFAAEVGFPSAARRAVDLDAVERALQAQAARLRKALAASLGEHGWSWRVARASPADAVAAALAEGYAPSLVIPPGSNLRAERRIVTAAELDEEELRKLLANARPLLILPRAEE